MKKRNFLIGTLVLAVVALIAFTPTSKAVESWTQTLMVTLDLGPQAGGAGVLQTNRVNTANALSSATLTQLIAAPASGSIYVDGILLETATATNGKVELEYGTGTNCGTGTTAITTVGPATSTSALPLGYYPLHLKLPAAKALCGLTDATTTTALVFAQ